MLVSVENKFRDRTRKVIEELLEDEKSISNIHSDRLEFEELIEEFSEKASFEELMEVVEEEIYDFKNSNF